MRETVSNATPTFTSNAIRLALWLAAVLALIGCAGTADQTADADVRTIDVRMVDIAFDPTTIDVEAGETVRFRFTNDGELPHDAFIGDDAAQEEHGEEMAEASHGGHGEDDSQAVTVEPGATAELVHTFVGDESIRIGCHQPGHYEAGMVLDLTIS